MELLSTRNLSSEPKDRNGEPSEAIINLSTHECMRARIVGTHQRPVLQIERCKVSRSGKLFRTGKTFEVGVHRTGPLVQLILEVVKVHEDRSAA